MAFGVSGFLALAVVGVIVGQDFDFKDPSPQLASCKIDWTFGVPCGTVKILLKNRIVAWSSVDSCGYNRAGTALGQYKFVNESENKLVAEYTFRTAGIDLPNTITITFKNTSAISCNVHGFSKTELWYRKFDWGVSYCTLENLVTGAGLKKVPGYTETTENAICTLYSSARCIIN